MFEKYTHLRNHGSGPDLKSVGHAAANSSQPAHWLSDAEISTQLNAWSSMRKRGSDLQSVSFSSAASSSLNM
jgi:hypothetical protein